MLFGLHNNNNRKAAVLPVIAQRQVGHIIQPFKRLRTDPTDLIPGDEQIPGVPGDPSRDAPQVSGDALHGVSRLRALAARRARRVHGAEQRAQNHALRQIQHVGGGGRKSALSESGEGRGGGKEKKQQPHGEKWINDTRSAPPRHHHHPLSRPGMRLNFASLQKVWPGGRV